VILVIAHNGDEPPKDPGQKTRESVRHAFHMYMNFTRGWYLPRSVCLL